MRFAGFPRRLRAGCVFDSSQRQQVALFRGVEKESGRNGTLAPRVKIAHGDGTNAIARGTRGNRLVARQHYDPPSTQEGREHFLEHRQRDFRLVRQVRDAAVARI